MKAFFVFLACLVLVVNSPFLQAQNPVHPTFDSKKNIPFGQVLPPPHMNEPGPRKSYSPFALSKKKPKNTLTNFHLTKALNPSAPGEGSFATPVGRIAKQEAVIVLATTPETGTELYRSDGTEAGTILLNDINPGAGGSNPTGFVFKNDLNYFAANNDLGSAIYSSDGTPGGLKRVSAYLPVNYFVTNINVTSDGQVFYILYHGNWELWHSDGSENGGEVLTQSVNYPGYTEIVGNLAFFTAGDAEHGYELWESDGTVTGTKMVKDINPGVGGSNPFSLFAYESNVYFGAFDGTGYSFWRSNGTENGTVITKNIAPAFYDYDEEPWNKVACVSNGILYFFGIDVATRINGLWKSNGTEAGTELVKAFGPDRYTFMHYLTDVEGTLYFTGKEYGVHGEGIWESGGMAENTVYIKEIEAGHDGSYFNYYLCNIKKKVYFINYSTYTLWSSDGTAETTNEVINDGLNGLYDIRNLTPAGDKLFFRASTDELGTELYVGEKQLYPLPFRHVLEETQKPLEDSKVSVSSLRAEKLDSRSDITLYPNPTRSNAALQISGDIKKVTVSITDISGKVIWKKVFNEQPTINLPLQKLNAGTYLVTVKNDKESKTLKLVKD